MGRWSRHPMGSDGALDAQDEFMSFADIHAESEDPIYYFERPVEEIRDLLLGLSLDQIRENAKGWCLNGNEFVIPYTFIEYNAYPTDPKIKEYLRYCLDKHKDFDEYGNGEEEKHVQLFKENFEDIISGKKKLENDPGLLAVINKASADGKAGLVNLGPNDD